MKTEEEQFTEDYRMCLAEVEMVTERLRRMSSSIAPKEGDGVLESLQKKMLGEAFAYLRSINFELSRGFNHMELYLDRAAGLIEKSSEVKGNPMMDPLASKPEWQGPYFLNEAHTTHLTKAQARKEKREAKKARESTQK